ncbi:hypothetical protein V3391_03835 [Luteimonas sp. SMYT11W]|uniref:Uncharacterized protein n=1 Tax=Luteimonas flava TaxID=3115822 RepID=A0ABU7WBK4_9GAMM
MTEKDLTAIREHPQKQHAWGRDDFRTMVEAKTKRFAGVRPAPRPTETDKET